MTTFVLLPGSFLGGWCWRLVAAELRRGGHDVFTPTLTGLGERAHLAGAVSGISTHIDDLAAAIEAEELTDAVIVAHSYAGAVMSGLRGSVRERVAAFVHLDAAVPEPGRSVFDLIDRAFADSYRRSASGGLIPFPAGTAERWAIPEGEGRAWLARRVTPHPLATLEQPLEVVEPAAHIRQVYVYCTVKPGLDVFAAAARNARDSADWTYLELPTGHVPQISHPEVLAQVFDRKVA
jgi:pimeloyl-ACP methyl ester carboxylesterase